MKLLSSLRNRLRKNLVKNQSGQGATEYILLLVVLVSMVMLFKGQIKEKLNTAMGKLGSDMDEVTSGE